MTLRFFRFLYLIPGIACLAGLAPRSFGQNTVLVMNSPVGEYIGQGYYYYYTPGDGAFGSEKNYRNGVTVSFVKGPGHIWTLDFSAPGRALLSPGSYQGAVRYGSIGDDENRPQMDVSGEGRGSNSLTGSFVVKEVTYGAGDEIIAFHATFSQVSGPDPSRPALTGEILFNASAPRPPDESDLHPPEEILYQAYNSGVVSYRPHGEKTTVVYSVGSRCDVLAFDRRAGLYYGGYSPSIVNGAIRYNGSVRRLPGGQIGGFENSAVNALACDKAGNLFVSELQPVPRVTRVDGAGNLSVWVSGLQTPRALAVDGAGNLYVADNGRQAIYKVSPTGTMTTVMEGQPEISALTFDGQGDLVVAYPVYGSVLKYGAQGGVALAAGLRKPISLAFDKSGALFIGDDDPHLEEGRFYAGRIYKRLPDGTMSQFVVTIDTPSTLAFAPHPVVVPMNISTRAQVGVGQNVVIGGFILSGPKPKQLIIRALGPSLSSFGVDGVLANPVLEIHDSAGNVIVSNDDWKTTQFLDIYHSGFAPTNDLESAVIAALNEGTYTAVLAGQNNTAGVGLLEIYDLETASLSRLANISTRSEVETVDGVMIGGFILGAGLRNSTVVVRALGPSLAGVGISDPLSDPVLELHDKDGVLVQSNDDWRESQEAQLQATGLAPNNDRESALVATVKAGNYTAVVRGKGGASGVGVVEVYHLDD